MIIFHYRPPSPCFREFVGQYQIVGFEYQKTQDLPWKPYWPRPENCLSFYPRKKEMIAFSDGHQEERKTRSAIMGQFCFLTHRQPYNNFFLFQVVFQPGALFRLTGIPLDLFTNTFVDAEAVFSPEIIPVNERLSNTNNHLKMIEIVEGFLKHLISRIKYDVLPIDRASLYLLNQPRNTSLDWLAKESCLSRKQFYRKFVERMGVSPKFYARISQFDNAIKLKNIQPEKDWLSIALEVGYYDYQHLVRDCKEFTGCTPVDFCHQEAKAPERQFGRSEI